MKKYKLFYQGNIDVEAATLGAGKRKARRLIPGDYKIGGVWGICDACGHSFTPPDFEHHETMSWHKEAVAMNEVEKAE